MVVGRHGSLHRVEVDLARRVERPGAEEHGVVDRAVEVQAEPDRDLLRQRVERRQEVQVGHQHAGGGQGLRGCAGAESRVAVVAQRRGGSGAESGRATGGSLIAAMR